MNYLRGLRTVFGRRRKLVFLVYILQLLFAIPLAWISYQLLGDMLGHSISTERLIGEFDYTIWRDMLNHEGEKMSTFWQALAVLLPLSLLVLSAASGGTYRCLEEGNCGLQIFLKGVRLYWWRYFVITFISLALMILWSILVWKWYLGDFMEFLEYWQDERQIAWLALVLFFVWTLGIYFIFLWNNLAKVDQLEERKNPLSSLRMQFKAAIGRYFSLGKPLIIIIALGLLITVFYLKVSSTLKPSAVIMLLILQQVVSWTKIGLRVAACEEVRVYGHS